jgi:hypothetical protein
MSKLWLPELNGVSYFGIFNRRRPRPGLINLVAHGDSYLVGVHSFGSKTPHQNDTPVPAGQVLQVLERLMREEGWDLKRPHLVWLHSETRANYVPGSAWTTFQPELETTRRKPLQSATRGTDG